MITDPIADLLTRIRNGQRAGHKLVRVRKSNMAERILDVLKKEGFIDYFEDRKAEDQAFSEIEVGLKYYGSGDPVISSIDRESRCGLRRYVKVDAIPQIHNGLGIAILSTSKGVLSDRQARKEKVGGELLATVS
jgi:small subunit ribosomal protein S8